MSVMQRRKGASGEREACQQLTDAFGAMVRRNLGQARDSGHDITLGRWSIEVKRRRALPSLYKWLEQANGGTGTPAVMLRADGEDWLVLVRFRDWARLAREDAAAEDDGK